MRDIQIDRKRQRVIGIVLLIFLFFPVFLYAQEKGVTSEKRLFHIERSKNRNLVCYDANLVDGKLDTKKPLDIYWVNQEDNPGHINGLSGIEKRFAYGYKTVSQGEDSSEVNLTAYSGRILTVQKLNGKYVCTIIINEQPAILEKLYVKAKPGNSLSVEYVELFGKVLATGDAISEKVVNKESK